MTQAKTDDPIVDFETGILREGRILVQRTSIGTVFLSIGPRNPEYAKSFDKRCAQLLKAREWEDGIALRYNPDEPRVPSGQSGGGEWKEEDQDSNLASDRIVSVGADYTANAAEKQKFVDDHLADAQNGARELNVPVENILGLSALESGWGKHPFAAQGKNFFGLHSGAPYSRGPMKTHRGKSKVATFNSYGESLKSFIKDSGNLVRSKSNPYDFMQALQGAGKFGVYEDGSPVPGYVESSVQTIKGITKYIKRNDL